MRLQRLNYQIEEAQSELEMVKVSSARDKLIFFQARVFIAEKKLSDLKVSTKASIFGGYLI